MGGSLVLHVAPDGDDSNAGTGRSPLATLQKAQRILRKSRPRGPRKVVIHAGTYFLNSGLQLGRADSGTREAPVVWEAARGETVRLMGGMAVPSSLWRPVEDPTVRRRLPAGVRAHVRQLDLRALGIEAPAFPASYHGAPPGPELYVNDTRMTLARWPNAGWATIARILEPGSRPADGEKDGKSGAFTYSGKNPSRWRPDEGVWLQGYWCYDWFDEVIKVRSIDPSSRRITLDAPHLYALKQGNPSPRRYRALNVLEELDQPGEFVIDAVRGRLYLLPPAPLATARVTAATLDSPILALHGASFVTLRGLTVECGLDHGIDITGGAGCRVERCEVRNLRKLGIRVADGTDHRVTGCAIHHTGTGGLVLGGGNRKTLRPGRHVADDNHIWRFSEHQFTSAYGLWFNGVGNRATHNRIHDAPHQAVFIGGNDHRFEYNEVHTVCTETDDCGALYKGRNPSCRGNLIRFNYWHDIGRKMGHGSAAVYFDDGDGGDLVFGNLFVRCGDPGYGDFAAVFSHGGHGLRADNNIFVDCKKALGSAPWDEARWHRALKGGENCFFPQKMLKEVNVTRAPYTTRYPELKGFMNPPPGAPRNSTARRNVFVRCAAISGGNWILKTGANWETDSDPGFVNAAKGDYRLRRGAEVFRRLKGFAHIPFERMGRRVR